MSAKLDDTSFAALARAQEQLNALQRTLKIASSPADPLEHYSLARAIAWRAGRCDASAAKFEIFVDEEYRRAGHARTVDRGIFIPPQVLTRAIQSFQPLVTGYGPELIETTLRPDLFIDVLRSRSVVGQLGAQFVPGLVGDVQLPRQTTASTAYWLTASGSPITSGAITEAEGAFDSSPLTVAPLQIGAFSKISRLLLQQSPLADRVIANDLLSILATALDQACLQGSGSGGAPLGIVGTSGVNAISGASFAYSTSVAALSALTSANAVLNRRTLGWTAPPATAATLAQRQKVSGFPEYIWSGNADTGSINSHAALASSNVPASTAIFGDWSQMLVLTWGDANQPIELETNAFSSGFFSGDVQIRAMMSANIAVRHPASFTVITGIT